MGNGVSVQQVKHTSTVYAREAYRTVQDGLKQTTRKARQGIEFARAVNRQVISWFLSLIRPFRTFSLYRFIVQLDLTGTKRKKAAEAARDDRRKKLRKKNHHACDTNKSRTCNCFVCSQRAEHELLFRLVRWSHICV